MTALEFVTAHPKVASLVCIVNLLAAMHVHELTIPLIVMQVFQLIAWTITIVVGSITIWRSATKFIKKYFKK